MRRYILLLVDLLVIAAATVLALILRDNLEVSIDRIVQIGPYLLLTLAAAGPVLLAMGLTRTLWRYSSLGDYLLVGTAAALIVLFAVALGFGLNRLESVARALPIIQGLLMACGLVGVRVASRLRQVARRPAQGVAPSLSDPPQTVLVVGLNTVTELFLRSVEDLAGDRVKVAGLLGPTEEQRGLLMRRYAVLGVPEELEKVLNELEVHGVSVDRIVVTMAFGQLTQAAQDALLHIERTSSIRLDFFAERILGPLDERAPADEEGTPPTRDQRAAAQLQAEIESLAARPYLRWKRVIDSVAAAVAMVCLAPLVLMVGILVMLDAGRPAIFWQQRPGARGWPFRLYKFRTMAAAHDSEGRRLSDAERLSPLGRFLRRSHLDELPQLYNILIGEMSFVGPRPLLPSDQSPAFAARLAVRPGLTGWAQIKGGRELSVSDKAALDVWYVRNASLRMDLQIIWGTIRTMWLKDRADAAAIRTAWRGIGNNGLMTQPPRRGLARQGSVVLSNNGAGAARTAQTSAVQAPTGDSVYR